MLIAAFSLFKNRRSLIFEPKVLFEMARIAISVLLTRCSSRVSFRFLANEHGSLGFRSSELSIQIWIRIRLIVSNLDSDSVPMNPFGFGIGSD